MIQHHVTIIAPGDRRTTVSVMATKQDHAVHVARRRFGPFHPDASIVASAEPLPQLT